MKTAGVLLAGGASSRMGHDKALLPWGNATLLERQYRLLESLGLDKVLVAGKRPGYPCVEDFMPYAGPLAALSNIVESLHRDTRMIVIAVDMPLLEKAHLDVLMEHAAPLVAYEGHPLPFAVTLQDDFINIMRTRLRRGMKNLRGLWDEVAESHWIEAFTKDFLLNANTPQEWQDFMSKE